VLGIPLPDASLLGRGLARRAALLVDGKGRFSKGRALVEDENVRAFGDRVAENDGVHHGVTHDTYGGGTAM